MIDAFGTNCRLDATLYILVVMLLIFATASWIIGSIMIIMKFL